MPTISVVIPAYNAAPFLPRSIGSILGQTRAPHEIIVVDDASSDDTAQVAAGFDGVTVVRHEFNKGVGPARNTGIEAASGEWIALLDADDEWRPGFLEAVERLIGTNRSRFVLTAHERVEFDGRRHRPSFRRSDTLSLADYAAGIASGNNVILPGAVAIRRDLLAEAGPFQRGRAEDKDYWLRLLSLTDAACTDEPLVLYHQVPGSIVNGGMKLTVRRCYEDTIRTLLPTLPRREAFLLRRMANATLYRDVRKAAGKEPLPPHLWQDFHPRANPLQFAAVRVACALPTSWLRLFR